MATEVAPLPPGISPCLRGGDIASAGIPGLGLLTDKLNLANAGRLAGWHEFLPESWTAPMEGRRKLLEESEPYTWLAKQAAHGIVTPVGSADDDLHDLLLLQRRVVCSSRLS